MAELAKQNAMNAKATSASTPGSNSRPAASGAAATNTFLTHCRGRTARTGAGTRLTRVASGGWILVFSDMT